MVKLLPDFVLAEHWTLLEQDFHQAQPVERECIAQMDGLL